jgi:hypothetical protein
MQLTRRLALTLTAAAACATASTMLPAASAAAATPTTGTTIEEYVDGMVHYLDSIWTRWMLANGLDEPVVATAYPTGDVAYTGECADGGVIDGWMPNAMYCPADRGVFGDRGYRGTVVIPLDGLAGFWSGDIWGRRSAVPGDFAAGFVVAHEFAHHIVDEIASQRGLRQPAWKYNELIADCLAGTATRAMDRDGLLEAGDVDEAVALLTLIGDDHVESPSHHGTAAERVAAFAVGLADGAPQDCIDEYWR